jgi:murein L,D-transpeptidase YcbB/YkuD
MSTLEHAGKEGLNSADYHVNAIHLRSNDASDAAATERDVLLTDGILAYAEDMRQGRARRGTLGFPVGLPLTKFSAGSELAVAIAAHRVQQFLIGLEPPHHEYAQLKAALARYRAIAEQGGWPTIPGGNTSISSDERLRLLRQRLAAEDPSFSSERTYQKDLLYALARYQHRNQLVPGSLSKATLDTLNVPASIRASQIAANMERWRWFSHAFASKHIEVNSADTTLRAVRDGVPVLTSNIIAGKPSSPTPIFGASVVAVTINPSWNIPDAIAAREIRPKAGRNPGYLAKEHIVADRTGRLRQIPGPWNALGRIKLEMPNRFNSYLHDTNSPALFARPNRHLSHGCMRVEQIKRLASFVLTGDSTAAAAKLEAGIAGGTTQRLSTRKPTPVYVGYWTALPDENGAVGFVADVYGWDRKVLSAMHSDSLGKTRVSVLTECSNANRS